MKGIRRRRLEEIIDKGAQLHSPFSGVAPLVVVRWSKKEQINESRADERSGTLKRSHRRRHCLPRATVSQTFVI